MESDCFILITTLTILYSACDSTKERQGNNLVAPIIGQQSKAPSLRKS
jgi:hypothetical protein